MSEKLGKEAERDARTKPIQPCTKCGLTFESAMFFALMTDAGAEGSVSPIVCHGGGEHNFAIAKEQSDE